MGCGGSKAADDAPAGGSPLLPTGSKGGGFQGTFQDAAAGRRSIVHKAQELEGEVTEDAPFDDAMIGTVTRHGIAPARGAGGSKAKINQDRGVVCWPFNGSHNQALLCVFDGHGMQGERISEFCAMEVPKRLEADRGLLASDATKCLIKNISALDKELLASPDLGPTARGAGTTSNVLYFNGETVYIACSGDSRAIMGKRAGGKVSAFDLSMDHKPDLPDERKRIEKAGGVVSAAGPNGLPPSRVWVNGRVGLAMSRSIGDGEAKGHGVIPDPEVKVVTVKPAANATADGDAFVCVASDGIWEFISSQQACDVISKHPTARGACVELVNLAEQRWKEEEGSYRDDITCVIAYLPFLEDLGDENLDLIATGNAEAGAYFQQKSDLASASGAAADADDDDDGKGDDFVKRRLSVAGPPIDLDA